MVRAARVDYINPFAAHALASASSRPINPALHDCFTRAYTAREKQQLVRLHNLVQTLEPHAGAKVLPGDGWKYETDKRVLRYPKQAVLSRDLPYNMGAVCREVARCRYAQTPSQAITQEAGCALVWAAVDSIRTSKLLCARYAGVRSLLQEVYRQDCLGAHDAPLLLQYAGACLALWMQDTERLAQYDPRVIKALQETVPFVQQAVALPANVDLGVTELTAAQRQASACTTEEVVLRDIWPVLKKLADEHSDWAPPTHAPGMPGGSGSGAPSPQDSAGQGSAAPGAGGNGSQNETPPTAPPSQDATSPKDPANGAPPDVDGASPGPSGDGPPPSAPSNGSGSPGDPPASPGGTPAAAPPPTAGAPMTSDAAQETAPTPLTPEEQALWDSMGLDKPKGPAPTGGVRGRGLQPRSDMEPRVSITADNYRTIVKQNGKQIDDMVCALEETFRKERLPSYVGHFKTGRYDLKKAVAEKFRAEATGTRDPKVFLRREAPTQRDVAFVLCADRSASMSDSERYIYLQHATAILLEAGREVGLTVGLLCYANQPTLLKGLDEDLDDAEAGKALQAMFPGGGTNEVPTLKMAAEMVEKSSATDIYIVFITDGNGASELPEHIKRLRANDPRIQVLGVGIGPGCDDVARLYEQHRQVPSIEALPAELGSLLVELQTGAA